MPLHCVQEEEALLSEMDVTGQAFEDMQEQNSRLMQQLREKDDANFKLMSERIKSNQIYKLLREEKEELADQVLTYKTQVRGTVEDGLASCVYFQGNLQSRFITGAQLIWQGKLFFKRKPCPKKYLGPHWLFAIEMK